MPDPESLIGRNLELRGQRIRELEAERAAIVKECDDVDTPPKHFKTGELLSLPERVRWAIWLGPLNDDDGVSVDQDKCRELLTRAQELEAERDRLRHALQRLMANCFGQGPDEPPKYATWAQAWRECRQALGEEEASQ